MSLESSAWDRPISTHSCGSSWAGLTIKNNLHHRRGMIWLGEEGEESHVQHLAVKCLLSVKTSGLSLQLSWTGAATPAGASREAVHLPETQQEAPGDKGSMVGLEEQCGWYPWRLHTFKKTRMASESRKQARPWKLPGLGLCLLPESAHRGGDTPQLEVEFWLTVCVYTSDWPLTDH